MHATLVTSNFGRHGFIQHLAKFNSNIPYNIVPYSKVPYPHLKKKKLMDLEHFLSPHFNELKNIKSVTASFTRLDR